MLTARRACRRIGAPVGTVVQVEDLFYNVPARLKFLKQDVTERRAIDALITRYALAYPDVRFKLTEGGSASLQTSGDGERRAILAALYGVDVARQMLDVESENEGFKLTGFISPVALTRSNRKEITFFINGRWVQDTPLTQALLQAYHTLLMVGRYPLAALFLEVPPEEVDVNVHPAKTEIRFRRSEAFKETIAEAVRNSLSSGGIVRRVTAARIPPGQEQIYYIVGDDERSVLYSPHLDVVRRAGYEVLIMADPLDAFMLVRLTQYKEHKLANVADADLKLPVTPGQEPEPEEAPQVEMGALVDRIRRHLGDQVSDVRLTTRLTDSPARLVDPQGAPNPEMQRVMRLLNQEFETPKKVLELNPHHPILQRLNTLPETSPLAGLIIDHLRL